MTVAQSQTADSSRRDFLYIATSAAGAVGATMAAWPLVSQMNPAANVLALSSIEVDISTIEPGQLITVTWRGKPTFIRRLTADEVAAADAVSLDDLLDDNARNGNLDDNAEATGTNRLAAAGDGATEWLVVVGVCTHLGCIPAFDQGDYGGWLCACHGSEYDSVGRVRVGPAPDNLSVPPFEFLSDTRVRIG
jgi:ubiquinol-cytochrome c reductase iron-sulfur subunit